MEFAFWFFRVNPLSLAWIIDCSKRITKGIVISHLGSVRIIWLFVFQMAVDLPLLRLGLILLFTVKKSSLRRTCRPENITFLKTSFTLEKTNWVRASARFSNHWIIVSDPLKHTLKSYWWFRKQMSKPEFLFKTYWLARETNYNPSSYITNSPWGSLAPVGLVPLMVEM